MRQGPYFSFRAPLLLACSANPQRAVLINTGPLLQAPHKISVLLTLKFHRDYTRSQLVLIVVLFASDVPRLLTYLPIHSSYCSSHSNAAPHKKMQVLTVSNCLPTQCYAAPLGYPLRLLADLLLLTQPQCSRCTECMPHGLASTRILYFVSQMQRTHSSSQASYKVAPCSLQ